MGIFLSAILGGSLLEIVGHYKAREKKSHELECISTKYYWSSTVAMIIGGGALALFYSSVDGVTLNNFIALNIGASAPAIVGAASKGRYNPNA